MTDFRKEGMLDRHALRCLGRTLYVCAWDMPHSSAEGTDHSLAVSGIVMTVTLKEKSKSLFVETVTSTSSPSTTV